MAISIQIGGACDQLLPDESDRDRQQDAVRQRADSRRDVDTFLDNPDIAIDQHHSDIELFISLQHIGDHRQNMQPSEHHRCGDIKLTPGFAVRAGYPSLGILNVRQDLSRIGQKTRAVIGQRHSARGTVEQRHTQTAFQFADRTGDRWRGHVQRLRRCGKSSSISDRDKHFKRLQSIHYYCQI